MTTPPPLDGVQAYAICPECQALAWIADPGGELHLMRLGEVPIEECETCQRVAEAVT